MAFRSPHNEQSCCVVIQGLSLKNSANLPSISLSLNSCDLRVSLTFSKVVAFNSRSKSFSGVKTIPLQWIFSARISLGERTSGDSALIRNEPIPGMWILFPLDNSCLKTLANSIKDPITSLCLKLLLDSIVSAISSSVMVSRTTSRAWYLVLLESLGWGVRKKS